MGKHQSVVFGTSIKELKPFNESFDKGVIRVAHTGLNNNGSYISKETFESSFWSIYNCPVVAHYDIESDEIGGHDVAITESGEIVNLTEPVGVVPESANLWWETVGEGDECKEYFCVDVLIWKRQRAYQKIKEEGTVKHSMEIAIKDYAITEGALHIHDFEFKALCLLERSEPCFESSELSFSVDDFKQQYIAMMDELKQNYSPSLGVDFQKGGENFMSDGLTAEQLRELLLGQLREDGKVDTGCGWYDYNYLYVDHSESESEVYYANVEDDWNLYGAKFEVSDGKAVIDYENAKRKRVSYVDFSNEHAEDKDAFSSLVKKYEEEKRGFEQSIKKSQSKCQELENDMAEYAKELDELKEYKASRLAEDRKAEENEIFEVFSDLDEIEEFENLKSSCSNMELGELETMCYAIRGKYLSKQKTRATEGARVPRLPVEKPSGEKDDMYGGLFSKYPPYKN